MRAGRAGGRLVAVSVGTVEQRAKFLAEHESHITAATSDPIRSGLNRPRRAVRLRLHSRETTVESGDTTSLDASQISEVTCCLS